jgi:O-antigen biosynthesis protein
VKIAFVIPAIVTYGGSISVVQLSEELSMLGHECAIVQTEPNKSLHNLTVKVLSVNEASRGMFVPDVYVATRFDTVSVVEELQMVSGAASAYFVQDFEPGFYKYRSNEFFEAEETYRKPLPMVVKSEWLAKKLEPFAPSVTKIPIGLDSSIFFDTNRASSERSVDISFMSREGSRRNSKFASEVAEMVVKRMPGTTVTSFGTLNPRKTSIQHLGEIKQWDVANLLRRTKVVLDPSLWQGLGRPGLEAMACGAVPVITPFGGVFEYASPRKNCEVLAPFSVEEWVEVVVQLLSDTERRDHLAREGLATSELFDLREEAKSWERFLANLLIS